MFKRDIFYTTYKFLSSHFCPLAKPCVVDLKLSGISLGIFFYSKRSNLSLISLAFFSLSIMTF